MKNGYGRITSGRQAFLWRLKRLMATKGQYRYYWYKGKWHYRGINVKHVSYQAIEKPTP